MVTWLVATCFADCHIYCTALYYIWFLKIPYHFLPLSYFILQLLEHNYALVYIFGSTLSRVSFLLLYIISVLYIVAILSLVLVRETK